MNLKEEKSLRRILADTGFHLLKDDVSSKRKAGETFRETVFKDGRSYVVSTLVQIRESQATG